MPCLPILRLLVLLLLVLLLLVLCLVPPLEACLSRDLLAPCSSQDRPVSFLLDPVPVFLVLLVLLARRWTQLSPGTFPSLWLMWLPP